MKEEFLTASPLIKAASSNSRFIFFLKNLFTKYYYFEYVFDRIYKESKIYKLIKKFREDLKAGFKYSFLGKIITISEKDNSAILFNSKFLHCLLFAHRKWQYQTTNLLKSSALIKFAEELKKEFSLSPLKITSTIFVIAIIINIFLSIFLKKEISLLGWITRSLFLFIGLTGLFCSADLQDIKQTSFVLKIFKK